MAVNRAALSPYVQMCKEEQLQFRIHLNLPQDLSIFTSNERKRLVDSIEELSWRLWYQMWAQPPRSPELELVQMSQPAWMQWQGPVPHIFPWGFFAYRVDYSLNDEEWNGFKEDFLTLVREKLFQEIEGIPDENGEYLRIVQAAGFQWIESKEELDDASIDSTRRDFQSKRGINMLYHRHWSETACIMVDLSVIDSVQRAKKMGFPESSSPPFAWVIDRFYGTFPISKPRYRGAFKVPLDTLLHEFYVDARDFKTIEPLCHKMETSSIGVFIQMANLTRYRQRTTSNHQIANYKSHQSHKVVAYYPLSIKS